MKNEKSAKEIIISTFESVRHVLDSTEYIGNPIKINEEEVIIPISKLIFGFGIGGSDLKNGENQNNLLFEYSSDTTTFGGSLGGISLVPEAFLFIKNGKVEIIKMKENKTIYDRLFAIYEDMSKYLFKKNKKK